MEVYQFAADFDRFRFDGRLLQISTKEELKTLFSCGMCPEPRAVWTLRITPTGVQNLGRRFLQPELKWADELLSRVDSGEDTTDIAEKKVVARLNARIREAQAEAGNQAPTSDKAGFSWGMLGACWVLRRGQRGTFVLVADEGQFRFSYVLHDGRPYFTEIEVK